MSFNQGDPQIDGFPIRRSRLVAAASTRCEVTQKRQSAGQRVLYEPVVRVFAHQTPIDGERFVEEFARLAKMLVSLLDHREIAVGPRQFNLVGPLPGLRLDDLFANSNLVAIRGAGGREAPLFEGSTALGAETAPDGVGPARIAGTP